MEMRWRRPEITMQGILEDEHGGCGDGGSTLTYFGL